MRERIIFVSGLSGSGKTTAMTALEDQSFYCVDNLPVQLTPQFLDLCAKSTPPIEKVALALDAREGAFLEGLPVVIGEARKRGDVTVIFLECADDALVEPLPRDPARASALPDGFGGGGDLGRARDAGRRGAPGRRGPGYDDPERPPAPRPRDPAVWRERRGRPW